VPCGDEKSGEEVLNWRGKDLQSKLYFPSNKGRCAWWGKGFQYFGRKGKAKFRKGGRKTIPGGKTKEKRKTRGTGD